MIPVSGKSCFRLEKWKTRARWKCVGRLKNTSIANSELASSLMHWSEGKPYLCFLGTGVRAIFLLFTHVFITLSKYLLLRTYFVPVAGFLRKLIFPWIIGRYSYYLYFDYTVWSHDFTDGETLVNYSVRTRLPASWSPFQCPTCHVTLALEVDPWAFFILPTV